MRLKITCVPQFLLNSSKFIFYLSYPSQDYKSPKNLQNWKKTFLDNAEIAMEPAKAVRECKTKIKELEARNDKYAKVVGRLTVERD